MPNLKYICQTQNIYAKLKKYILIMMLCDLVYEYLSMIWGTPRGLPA